MSRNIVFDPIVITPNDDGSEPMPPATTESRNGHQWYMTCTDPATTISAGTGPGGNGLFMATAASAMMSSGGSMAIQSSGAVTFDGDATWTLRVTGDTKITTAATIDMSAVGIIKVTAGAGQAAVLRALTPGAEGGGQIGPANSPTIHLPPTLVRAGEPRPAPRGSTHSNPVTSATGYAMAGKDIAVGLGEIAAGNPIGGLAEIAIGSGILYGKGQGKSADIARDASNAAAALAAIDGDGGGGGGGGPHIDMLASEMIKGTAMTGIKWYTPAAISEQADAVIRSTSPIIKHLANSLIQNVSDGDIKSSAANLVQTDAGSSIKNSAGSLVKTEAPFVITSASTIIDMSAGAAMALNALGMMSVFAGAKLSILVPGKIAITTSSETIKVATLKEEYGHMKHHVGHATHQVGHYAGKFGKAVYNAGDWAVKGAKAQISAAVKKFKGGSTSIE